MVRTKKIRSRKHGSVHQKNSKTRTRTRSRSHTKSRKATPIRVLVHKPRSKIRSHRRKYGATAKQRSPLHYQYDPELGNYVGKIEVVVHSTKKHIGV